MTAEFQVPKRVAENIARRHAAEQVALRCVYGCRAHARLYPCGARCDEHSPWALAGHPDPSTQVDPRYTLDGLRAAAGLRTDGTFAPAMTVLDKRNRDAGRTVSPERRRNAHDGADHITLTDRFRAFHEKNPHIYIRLEELVAEGVSRGFRRIGISALFERLRADAQVDTRGDAFKVNNDFRADYARLLIARHPEWTDLFELRERKSA